MNNLIRLLLSISLLIIISCDSSSSPTAGGGGSGGSSGGTSEEIIANKVQLTFDATSDEINSDSFNDSFANDIATSVGCDASQVNILDKGFVGRGSAYVNFVFEEVVGGQSADSLLTTIQNNIASVQLIGEYTVEITIANLSDSSLPRL